MPANRAQVANSVTTQNDAIFFFTVFFWFCFSPTVVVEEIGRAG
jgi:hypothetical protein